MGVRFFFQGLKCTRNKGVRFFFRISELLSNCNFFLQKTLNRPFTLKLWRIQTNLYKKIFIFEKCFLWEKKFFLQRVCLCFIRVFFLSVLNCSCKKNCRNSYAKKNANIFFYVVQTSLENKKQILNLTFTQFFSFFWETWHAIFFSLKNSNFFAKTFYFFIVSASQFSCTNH